MYNNMVGLETPEDKRKALIEAARGIIEDAEKEGIDKLMTQKELIVWRANYNKHMNEGGEGYIPYRISKELYKQALNIVNGGVA